MKTEIKQNRTADGLKLTSTAGCKDGRMKNINRKEPLRQAG
jgi:hypothetical protein